MSMSSKAVLRVNDSIQSKAAEPNPIKMKRNPLSHISFGFLRSFMPTAA